MVGVKYVLLFFAFGLTQGTFTRVGNTYMKTPDSCCSMEVGEPVKGCDMTSLHATEREQLAYSPGFPNRFPIGRMCMWSIQAKLGYQVRLEFRDFYLIGPGKTGHCSDQYVMVESPLTGHTMGRFCGNSGIPTIVSAGNLLVVKLYSEIPQSSENFRGFVVVFKETLETPNQEMRPGDWANHDQFSLNPRGIAKKLLTIKPTNAPDPNAMTTTLQNRITASRATPSHPNEAGNAEVPQPTNNKKKYPKQNNTPKFARPGSNYGNQNIYGQNQNRNIVIRNDIEKDSELPLRLEYLVAIGAGGLCATALIILICCKINQVCKRNGQRNPVPSEQNDRGNGDNTTEQTEKLEMSPPQYSPNKDFQLPAAPQEQEINMSIPNPNPYPPEYYSSSNYPYYSANAATMPHSLPTSGTMSTCLSNTLPAVYSTTPELQAAPSYPLPIQATPQMGNPLLLFDPTTGMVYNPNSFHQPPQSQTLTMNKIITQQPSSKTKPYISDSSDASSESSWSSDSSEEDRRPKDKTLRKRRKNKHNTSKSKKQNRRRRRRRRK